MFFEIQKKRQSLPAIEAAAHAEGCAGETCYNRATRGSYCNSIVEQHRQGMATAESAIRQPKYNYTYTEIGELKSDELAGIDAIEWRVDKKVKSVSRTSTSGTSEQIEFEYDAMGNRVMKLVKPTTNGSVRPERTWTYTYYMRDAAGNVMSIYTAERNAEDSDLEEFRQTEIHLYGASRLGLYDDNLLVATYDHALEELTFTGSAPTDTSGRMIGKKVYEYSNHLGNVLLVTSDRKLAVDIGSNGSYDYFEPEVLMEVDYYPFGMEMEGRKNVTGSRYRYGLNGMELDPEWDGEGNHYTTMFRQYDPRVGRWLSLDPLAWLFPYESPYAGFGNNPIFFKDPSGLAPTNDGSGDETKELPTMVIKGKKPRQLDYTEDPKGLPSTGIPNGARIVIRYESMGEQSYRGAVFNYNAETESWSGIRYNEAKDGKLTPSVVSEEEIQTIPSLTWKEFTKKKQAILQAQGGTVSIVQRPVIKKTTKKNVQKKSVVKTDQVQNGKHVEAAKKQKEKEEESKELEKKIHDTASDLSTAKTMVEGLAEGAKYAEDMPVKYASSGRFTPKVGPSGTVKGVLKKLGPAGALTSAGLSWTRAANTDDPAEKTFFAVTGGLHALSAGMMAFGGPAGYVLGSAIDIGASLMEAAWDLF